MEGKIALQAVGNFWLLTRMFSRLLSLTLEAIKNGKIAVLCRNNSPLQGCTPSQGTTYSVEILSQKYTILTSTLEEMRSLKYF